MARAFIIRPFGVKPDSQGTLLDFERVERELIDCALDKCELFGRTTGDIVESGNIREDMFELILEADVVVCDITILNANVFYELGIRHALRKRSTILIRGVPTPEKTPPFDLLTDRYMAYSVADPGKSVADLVAMIDAARNSLKTTDSPVFRSLPQLEELDASRTREAPIDFREEVARARAAKSAGWLRLLAEEVQSRRFVWSGLKLVGQAQWGLNDLANAQKTWEQVQKEYPADIEANLALANIHERAYRRSRKPQLLTESSQAIDRVLANGKADRAQRAEALALRGRNEKSQWRLKFEGLPTLEERRREALHGDLRTSYESYRKAFLSDLNHYWSGIAAAQMGTILVDLSKEPYWADAFPSDNEATDFQRDVVSNTKRLVGALRLAIEAAQARLQPGTDDLIWAKISEADVRFLDPEMSDARVLDAYVRAVPTDEEFAWDATRGQLELFQTLGIRAELAAKIIARVNAAREAAQVNKKKAPEKPLHLILFAGHQVDLPGRQAPRFPPDREAAAKALIEAKLKALLNEQEEFITAASASPGADILAHEICIELGLPSTVCLPMPENFYAQHTFSQFPDAWRNRFLNIVDRRKGEILELSHQEGLPRWLHGADTDPWERGNRWVMHMAQTWGAKRITLIALWDQRPVGNGAGGTADFVELARKAANVHVELVDANQLLS